MIKALSYGFQILKLGPALFPQIYPGQYLGPVPFLGH